MSLVSIGSVTVDLREPTFSWASSPTAHGLRVAHIGGLLPWTQAHELSELVANPVRQETWGDQTGVKELVEFDGSRLAPFAGWYLLISFSIDAEHQWSVQGGDYQPVPVSLEAAYRGAAA